MRKLSEAYLGMLLLALGGCYLGSEIDDLTSEKPDPDDPTEDPSDPTVDPTGPEDNDPPPGTTCSDERVWAVDFLDRSCSACHGAGSITAGGLGSIPDLNALLAEEYLLARDSAGSKIWQQVDSGTMPPGAPVEDGVSERLAAFIDGCLDPLPKQDCTNNEVLTIEAQLNLMIADISKVDADDRGFTRYFTLTHLHNIGYCAEDIDVYAQSVAQLTNALSTEERVVAPRVVEGSFGTILRIDLRDYGWDEPVGVFSNKWEALIETSQYAVERLEQLAETLKEFSGTRIPFMQGDAYIDVASQPPLYHDLADVPETVQELTARLGIDIAQNIADREVARAGVLNSGVSSQNRLIERHQVSGASNRTFWISYDFGNDAVEAGNIFANPLGFEADGGEVIFSQPNGFYAFMLIVATGERIDLGPDNVVTDPGQPDGTVRNGISCFSCHHRGMINVVDQVRPSVERNTNFSAQEKDLVADLHPLPEDFAEIQDLDSANYQLALKAAGVEVDVTTDAVSAVFSLFDLPVDLQRAAAELGVDPEQLSFQLGRLDNALAPLRDGSVKRDTWNELFAETVCTLQIGVTAACPVEEGE